MGADYSVLTLAHFRHPRNVGLLPEAPDVVRTAAGSQAQEAMFQFSIRIDRGQVRAVGWQAWGCPHVIAAASLASDWLVGRELGDIMTFDWRNISQLIDIPAHKSGRLLLLEDVLHALPAAAARLADD